MYSEVVSKSASSTANENYSSCLSQTSAEISTPCGHLVLKAFHDFQDSI